MQKLNFMRRSFQSVLNCYLLLFPIIFMLFSCGGGVTLKSHQLAQQGITIDGKTSDWEGKLISIEKKHISVGFSNDDHYLYACLVTEDRTVIRQILGWGLTLWFNPDGKENKVFGIHYPVGQQERRSNRSAIDKWRISEAQDSDSIFFSSKFSPAKLNKIEIIRADRKERLKFKNLQKLPDIKVKLTFTKNFNHLAYEVKVPLRSDEKSPYGIGVTESRVLAIGFETDSFRSTLRKRHRREEYGRGYPGSYSREPQNYRRDRGEKPPKIPEPLKLWVKVALISKK